MQRKIIIPIIAVLCSVLILSMDYQKAYALTIISAEPYPSQPQLSTLTRASPNIMLATGITGGTVHAYFVGASSLSAINNVDTTLTTQDGLPICTTTQCYIAGKIGTNPAVARMSTTGASLVVYSEVEYAGCFFTVWTTSTSGGTLLMGMGDLGGCPATGLYTLSQSFTEDVGADNVQYTLVNTNPVFDSSAQANSICNMGNTLVWTRNNPNNDVVKYSISGNSFSDSASIGSVITDATCGGGYVYVTSNVGNIVRRVSVSSLSIESDTIAITGPQNIMYRGGSVYVSRSGAATITVANATLLTSSFVFYTASHNAVMFATGNSTRFNMIAPTANDNIYYRVDGVIAEELEEEETAPNAEFCSQPENANVLTCRLEDQQGALVGSSDLINQTSNNIGCMVGIIACTQDENGNFVPNNPDIQTNGMGYLLWVIALGVMVGMFWVAGRGDLSSIPTFLWFIGAIGITLVITVFGWIDPTALIISVIVVIAFAVARVKGVFGGGGSLMNEQLQ